MAYSRGSHKHKYEMIGSVKRSDQARRYRFRCYLCGTHQPSYELSRTSYQIWHPEKWVWFSEESVQHLAEKYELLYTPDELLEIIKEDRKLGRTAFCIRLERGVDGVWRQAGFPDEEKMIAWAG